MLHPLTSCMLCAASALTFLKCEYNVIGKPEKFLKMSDRETLFICAAWVLDKKFNIFL